MGHSRPIFGPAESKTSHTALWMPGGRKWTCTSNSPGSPSSSQNARTGAMSSRRSVSAAEVSTGSTGAGSVIPSLETAAHGLLGLPVGLPLGQGVPLVPRLLAPRQGDLDLGPAVEEVDRQGHPRDPLLGPPPLDLVDLLAVEQQLALAPGRVVGPGALGVLRDVHVVQPRLTAVDVHEPVDQRGPPLAQRLHLGALEDEARLVGVLDGVVVPRLAVLRDDLAPLLPGHPVILASRANGIATGSSSGPRRCRPGAP